MLLLAIGHSMPFLIQAGGKDINIPLMDYVLEILKS
jgi:hypothetical protein